MVRAIMFDLDNTLIDFFHFKLKCCSAAIDAMIKAGLKVKKRKAIGIFNQLYGQYGMEYKYIFQKFLKIAAGKIDYRILSYGLIAYRKERTGCLNAYPGVKDTINKLKKNYKIAIISDAPRQKAWMRIDLMGLDKLVDVVITFDDTKRKKPNSLPFIKALKRLKLKPSEVLMVGDSISRDMQGAKRLGMKTCLALYGRTIKPKRLPKGTDFMINRIFDLMKVVKKV